jgi:dimethylamine monooxygenase subunit A
LKLGSDLVEQLKQRNELLDTNRSVVFQEVAGYKEAALTYARAIKDNLSRFHSDYAVNGDQITHQSTGISVNLLDDHPFVQLARVITEDLCLLSHEDSTWKLVAGVVIFPSRWKLLEKLEKILMQYTSQCRDMREHYNH